MKIIYLSKLFKEFTLLLSINMEATMKETSNLHNNIMSEIKATKSKFKKIIKFINENKQINDQLSGEIKNHLRHLIKLWQNNNDANIDNNHINADYYFQMKEHHSHINGMIKDENLNKMWKDYLVSGMEFRVKLMGLNNTVVIKD